MNETPYRLATYAQSKSIVRAVTGDEPAIFAYRPVALVPSEEAFSFMTIEKDLGQQLTRLGHEAPHTIAKALSIARDRHRRARPLARRRRPRGARVIG